jgi:hypothetical protein
LEDDTTATAAGPASESDVSARVNESVGGGGGGGGGGDGGGGGGGKAGVERSMVGKSAAVDKLVSATKECGLPAAPPPWGTPTPTPPTPRPAAGSSPAASAVEALGGGAGCLPLRDCASEAATSETAGGLEMTDDR